MKIKFYANEKKYGTKAVNIKPINLNITTVSQIIEAIRDGFIPMMNPIKTQGFMLEMMYRELDKGNKKINYDICISVIETIMRAYNTSRIYDIHPEHALMIFHEFLKTGCIDFQKILAMY